MYVYCVESFAHIECYSNCSSRGSHLLRCCLVCIVLSLYNIECCTLLLVLRGCVFVCLLLYKKEGSSPVSFQLLRGGIWALYEVPLSVSLLGFWDRDYV